MLVFFTGSCDDVHPGERHLFEHLPFRASKDRIGYSQTLEQFKLLGGTVNAMTDQHLTCYQVRVPGTHARAGAEHLIKLACQPRCSQEDIDAEREVILSEISMRYSNPGEYSRNHFIEHLFAGTPFAHPVAGSEETLDLVTPDMLRELHRSSYTRERCAWIVAGGIEHDTLATLLEGVSVQIPTGSHKPRRTASTLYAPTFQGWGIPVESAFPFGDSHIRIYVPMEHEVVSQDAVSLVDNQLSLGADSVLMKALREEHKLVYGVITHAFTTTVATGLWLYMPIKPGREDRALDVLWQTFDQFANVHPWCWLPELRARLRAEAQMRDLAPAKLASLALGEMMKGRGVEPESHELDRLDAVTADEIIEVSKALKPANAAVFIYRGSS
ncbi:hypothetical protein GVX82_04845 [Patescibacteria group bacterium]|nr:hypothetical protein [Patescibacteria group bacterium]